ncbi:MAG TPA: MFS transporter [Verrucomicrobia bacterium]|nr:MFS transporter [Verrucomicrobiota bacterium]
MRWRILFVLFTARIGLGFQFQTMGSVSNDLIYAFGLDYTEIGTLVGLFLLPGMFLAIPAGLGGRYFSDRLLVGLGLVALALGGLASGWASDPWLVGVGRAVSGVGFVLSSLYFTKMVADWFSGREIATAMGILVMSWPFGIAAGQIGHEWIAVTAGWRWTFIAASAYCLAAAIAVFIFYEPPLDTAKSGKGTVSGLSGHEWYLTLLASATWGVFNAGYIVYLTFGPLVLENDGIGALEAAAIISVGSWLMIFSGAACGQISDRSKRPNLVLGVCMVGAIGALGVLAVDGFGLTASLVFGLVGMAPAGVIMALTGEAMRPERRAFGMGVFLSAYFLINAVAPPIAGWIYDTTLDPFNPIIFGMVLFGSAILINAWFRTVQRRSAPLMI